MQNRLFDVFTHACTLLKTAAKAACPIAIIWINCSLSELVKTPHAANTTSTGDKQQHHTQ
jgi:hypothetical protein